MIRNAFKLSSSNLIMCLLPLVVTPILSRLYLPEDFGEWGVFSSIVSIITLAICAGYDNAIVKARDSELKSLVIVCAFFGFLFLIVVTTVLGLVSFLGYTPAEPSSLWLLWFYLALYLLYTISYNVENRFAKYNILAYSNMVLGISQALLRILFGTVLIFTCNGLILGTTLALLMTVLCLCGDALFSMRRACKVSSISKAGIGNALRRYKNFPLYDTPSSLLSYAALFLPLIILSVFYSKVEIGSYSIVLQLLLSPMALVGSALGKVYYQQIAIPNSPTDYIRVKTKLMLKLTATIAFLPIVFIVLGGDKLIVYFLGAGWEMAGKTALCLSIWSFPTILTQPILPLFRALDKQRILLWYDIAYFVLGIAAIWGGSMLGYGLCITLTIYSIASAIVKLFLFVRILKLTNLSLRDYRYHVCFWAIIYIIALIRISSL